MKIPSDRNVEVYNIEGEEVGRGVLIDSGAGTLKNGVRRIQVAIKKNPRLYMGPPDVRFPLSIRIGKELFDGRYLAPIMRRDGNGVMHEDHEFFVADDVKDGLKRAFERVGYAKQQQR